MLDQHYEPIRLLLRRVRARWRALSLFHAVVRSALGAAAAVGVGLAAFYWSAWPERAPLALAALGALTLAAVVALLIWGMRPLRRVPSDANVARYIEERVPSLDDRLATAVDFVESARYKSLPAFAEPLVADAARCVNEVDLDVIVPRDQLRRAGAWALAAALVLLTFLVVSREPARQSVDAASLVLFPAHVRLDVTPGHARVKAAQPLVITARLVGNRAPVAPAVQIADGDTWRGASMSPDGGGGFRLAMASVTSGFKYRVAAGALVSPTYEVTVVRPPRVAEIDVDYTYPPDLGLSPRRETDGGDIYAPAGTDVRIQIHTDRAVANGHMAFGDGASVALALDQPTLLTTTMRIAADNSYRIALADGEGLSDSGDTEYFIRVLQDRPPEVHIVRPASDRAVTRLEEVDIEAEADDDYGIDQLELVYSIRGAEEKAVPFDVPRRATSVKARRTLYIEDLDVQPGDFVSYYARARDITRGARANEARSDIFFLEVKPFEQEFALAQSQSMSGSGYTGSIDELVNAQKQIVVATWKIDRRGQNANGAQSEQDIRSIARSEAELKTRVEQTASSFRESTMRDPRRRTQGDAPRAGQTMPEEDAMAVAAEAMGKAVVSLNALKTGPALPPEMQALNALLRAQAAVKRRQLSRQQSGQGGPGNNNRNYDISTLFDKELQRSQQTNYETRSNSEQPKDPNAELLDKIKDLARRLDELLKRQQDLAQQHPSDDELKRQLEKLTRDQSELRQKAEELARQMASQAGPSGRRGQSARSGGESDREMREVSEEMRNATNDLRRRNPAQASARGSRALDKLRDIERQLQSSGRGSAAMSAMNDKRRALGDMHLEARQLADAQRQVASELSTLPAGESGKDGTRRLAGDEERLAERARRLQEGLKQQSGASDAARELERQRLGERMQKSADQMRAQAGGGADPKSQAAGQQEIARELDKLADRLQSAMGPSDAESRKLSDQLARAQELRERIDRLTRDLEKLGRESARSGGSPSSQKTPGQTGRTGEGQRAGAGGTAEDVAKLREEYERQLQQTRELVDELRRQDPTFARGGAGFTFEGQGMTLAAPGTEAFKQDFAKWQELRVQATQALEHAESSLAKQIQDKQSRDRLAAGVDDKVPPEYRKQVDSYFKALATKQKP